MDPMAAAFGGGGASSSSNESGSGSGSESDGGTASDDASDLEPEAVRERKRRALESSAGGGPAAAAAAPAASALPDPLELDISVSRAGPSIRMPVNTEAAPVAAFDRKKERWLARNSARAQQEKRQAAEREEDEKQADAAYGRQTKAGQQSLAALQEEMAADALRRTGDKTQRSQTTSRSHAEVAAAKAGQSFNGRQADKTTRKMLQANDKKRSSKELTKANGNWRNDDAHAGHWKSETEMQMRNNFDS